ncbi:Hypothetical predicted protein [Paramuricea clavata]|uniref:Uncharacterized protein n=1 Tax=Paramuricea clavata TaxID=317549 RepID=A0A6S7HHN4_PARCT|nr:Hypothetical predicted protein [Paramuricea clavata]
MDEIDAELFEVDDSCGQNDSETSSNLLENVNTVQFTKSTKEPLKVKASRKKQAEEEFKLLKNLAVSTGERKAKKAKLGTQNNGTAEYAFGRYVVHALSELDPATRIFSQHEIINILFQAQTGELRSKHSIRTLPPSPVIQPQQQTFQPISRPNIIPRPSAILKSSDHHSSARIVNHAVVYHL